MTNIFNSVNSVPYTAPAEVSKRPEIQVRDVVSSNPVGSDSVEISGNKKVKKGPIKALKGFIGNVKKFFASASEYVKGVTVISKDSSIGDVLSTVLFLMSVEDGQEFIKKHDVEVIWYTNDNKIIRSEGFNTYE